MALSDLANYQSTVLRGLTNFDNIKPVSSVSNTEFKRKQILSFSLYLSLEKLTLDILSHLETEVTMEWRHSLVFFFLFPVTLLLYQVIFKKVLVQQLTEGVINKLKNTFLVLPIKIMASDTYLKSAFLRKDYNVEE